ncbi:hypothetical protein G7075_00535 [Phycicoccus sp. HDW14]|uniref:hypothetical protein n=1 Tax=Phycicoccus sp. HDW14 TaxID=2714941 RepID=UPI00140A158F|nr:hypothetical protein [Phycicoccus sp. HDW14]QIM19970.1 hypothetical protein G7075_00535 [Phycicoccus sp. HDW14]
MTLVVATASAALEVAQFVLGVGRSDVTDVLSDTAGGLLGLAALAVVRAAGGARATTLVRRACSAATVVAVLAAGLYALSPVRLLHVHDVGSAAGAVDERIPLPAVPGG